MILVGDQTAGDFGKSFGRENRFGALAGITAPDAADVKRGSAGVAFEGRITLFSEDIIHSDRSVVFFLRERNLGNHRTLFIGDRQDIIVEAGNRYSTVLIDDLSQHFAECIDGVFDRSAKMS